MNLQIYPLKVSKLLFKNFCYLIVNPDAKTAILIDPAWEIQKIKTVLEIQQVNLSAILITHHHFDHINLAEPLAHEYNIPVLISKIEKEYYSFNCHNLELIEQNDVLCLGQININPIFTPGHTKGSMSYLIEDSLFTGDTLFIEGCGTCIGKGGDPSAMFDTLSRLKTTIPHHIKIYPGHSYGEEPGKTFAYLLQNNIYLQFNNREKFIAFRMRENQQNLMAFK